MSYPYGWKTVWVLALFDLPTATAAERKAYASFRKNLLNDGFSMMQYSVYMRHCASFENATAHIRRMGHCVPRMGEVRFIRITDKQFSLMVNFTG